jgi:hypothetical protein
MYPGNGDTGNNYCFTGTGINFLEGDLFRAFKGLFSTRFVDSKAYLRFFMRKD